MNRDTILYLNRKDVEAVGLPMAEIIDALHSMDAGQDDRYAPITPEVVEVLRRLKIQTLQSSGPFRSLET